jgi:uncharacterized protein YjdB
MTYSLGNTGVVEIDEFGVIHALSAGTVTVTGTTSYDVRGTFKVTVTEAASTYAVEAIAINPTAVSVQKDKTAALEVKFTPGNATDQRVVWHIEDESVASLTEADGKATVKGLKEGVTKITAVSNDGGHIAECSVTVTEATPTYAVEAIAINPAAVSVQKDKTAALEVKFTPGNATDQRVVWHIEDESVVSLTEADGKATVKGLKAGVTKITAVSNDGGYTAECSVTVTGATTVPDEGGVGGGATLPPSTLTPDTSPPVSTEDTPSGSARKFDDVKLGDWFYDAVRFVAEKGIAQGVSVTPPLYDPKGTVTRAQFITMLCRAYDIDERNGDNFADAGNTWYTGYLAAAKQLGISNGVGDNKFAPDNEITREEMVVLLYNYVKSVGGVSTVNSTHTYADSSQISSWAVECVAFATEKQWVKGKDNNIFDPKGTATRAELARIFYNVFASGQ